MSQSIDPLKPTDVASIEATSLRAFSVDEPASITASSSEGEQADVESAPALRVPFRAKLLFGLVLGSCGLVIALAVPKLRAEVAAKKVARSAHVAVAVSPPPPKPTAVVPAALLAPVSATAPPPLAVQPVNAPKDDHVTTAVSPPNATEEKATIRISKKGHTLKVDGKPVKGRSVDVACGKHLVAVDAEKPHRVDAPCGQTLTVDEKKARDPRHSHKGSSAPPSAKAKAH